MLPTSMAFKSKSVARILLCLFKRVAKDQHAGSMVLHLSDQCFFGTSHFHHRELIMQGRIEIRARLISRSFVCGKQTTTKKLLVGSEHLLHGVTHRQAGNRV